jgi:hypothetical protein
MSHVDEGNLHAYLDGALAADDPQRVYLESHFADCAECRTRLEQERTLRERASQVLRQMAPDAVRVEPFESMLAARRARAAATGNGPVRTGISPERSAQPAAAASGAGAGRRTRRSPWPLALAATMLLAVTATWFARIYLPARPDANEPALQKESDAVTGAAAGAVLPQTAPAPQPGAPPAESPRDEAVRRDAPAAAGNRIEEQEGQEGRARIADPEKSRQEAAAATPPPPVQQQLQAQPQPRTQQAQQRSSQETRRLGDSMVAQRAVSLDQVTTPAGAANERFAGTLDDLSQRRLDAATTAVWRSVTMNEAARILARAPATVEGLRVDSVQTASAGGTQLVRVLQHLDDARPVELLQWPAVETRPTESPRAGAAAGQVTATGADRKAAAGSAAKLAREPDFRGQGVRDVRLASAMIVGGVNVVIRAALPADSLALLVRRVR